MTERTTVRLPEELLVRAKRKAAAEGRTLTALIEDGLRIVVDDRTRARTERRLPRISTCEGGLLPGINLDDGSLDEAEDLAYIQRMRTL